MFKLNVNQNSELDELKTKIAHIKNIDQSIAWVSSRPGSLHELKTAVDLSSQEAESLLHKIKELEKDYNHSAYVVMESQKTPGIWRIIVNVNKIKLENSTPIKVRKSS